MCFGTACLEICVETNRPTAKPTDPDEEVKIVWGRTIKIENLTENYSEVISYSLSPVMTALHTPLPTAVLRAAEPMSLCVPTPHSWVDTSAPAGYSAHL